MLADRAPSTVKNHSASQTSKIRDELLLDPDAESLQMGEFVETTGTLNFLNALRTIRSCMAQQTCTNA